MSENVAETNIEHAGVAGLDDDDAAAAAAGNWLGHHCLSFGEKNVLWQKIRLKQALKKVL